MTLAAGRLSGAASMMPTELDNLNVTETPSVAIAVVSWNTREPLSRCLGSLERQAEDWGIPVWVIDNGSTDGSPEMVRQQFPWAKLVEAGANLGFGAAINLVADRVWAEWLVAANADVECDKEALETLLDVGRSHPEAGVLAPRLELPSGATQRSCFPFPRLHRQALAAVGVHRISQRLARRLGFEEPPDDASGREVDYAMGAFLLVRRNAFEAVGRFDPAQWMYSEDLDICWRLRRARMKTLYVPSATVRHAGGAATDISFSTRVPMLKLAAQYAWLERRRGRWVMYASAGLNLLGATLRLSLLCPLARISPRRWAPARDRVIRWLRINRVALGARRSTESSLVLSRSADDRAST